MTTESSKPSRSATLSLILGIVIWLMWCGLYGTLGIMAENNTLDEGTGLAGFILGPVVLGILTFIIGTAGVVFGIQAIRRQDPKRGLAIAGLVMNFICLCPILLLIGFMIATGISSLPDAINQLTP